ncbi:aldo/keto reductase [Variovorax sp. HJSM1_2]|uniref:aldo/keto reductase n=1 Tax=Variovorax sp. HJSM1_2 TaxID=3366263 RepID=UPI003BDAD726
MRVTFTGTDVATSAMALGCARLGSALTPLGRRECIALVEQAFELGIRHFDTASVYGQGDSERYIGEALAAHRGDVCLASKAGQRLSGKQMLLSQFKTPIRWLAARRAKVRASVSAHRAQGVPRCFEVDYVERSLEASLKRLNTGYLDLFYLHSPDLEVLSDDVLMGRMQVLGQRGLFRAFGVSCDEIDVAWAAAQHEAVQAVQFAFDHSREHRALLDTLSANGKSAVLRGFVHGAADGQAPGSALSTSFAQTLRLPAVRGLIVGTTKLQHLRQNVAAFARALEDGALHDS